MARHSFVTDLEVQRNWAGLVKGIQPDQKTVEILSRSDVRKIVLEVIDEEVWDKLKSKERKITKVGEQAETAVKDAKVARKEIQRFVETARETFRDVIDELLVPHYRFLAQHLGIELSDQLTREASKNRTASTRETSSAALSNYESVSAKTKKKTTRRIKHDADEDRKDTTTHPLRKTASTAKTPVALKKMATRKKPATGVAQPRRKGTKPCLK